MSFKGVLSCFLIKRGHYGYVVGLRRFASAVNNSLFCLLLGMRRAVTVLLIRRRLVCEGCCFSFDICMEFPWITHRNVVRLGGVLRSILLVFVVVWGGWSLRRALRVVVEQGEFGQIPAIAIYVKALNQGLPESHSNLGTAYSTKLAKPNGRNQPWRCHHRTGKVGFILHRMNEEF